jgi:hypothetical protein
MIAFLKAARDWLMPPRIVTAEAAEELLTRAAANLAHKSTVGYCQIKAGPHHRVLFRDPAFMANLERSRWQSFATVLADFAVLTEGFLRTAATAGDDHVASWLTGFYARRLAPGPLAGAADGGLDALVSGLAGRLDAARFAPPRPPAAYGEASAKTVLRSLPYHPSVTQLDLEMLVGMVRFGTIAFWAELTERGDAAGILASLPLPPPVAPPRRTGDAGRPEF